LCELSHTGLSLFFSGTPLAVPIYTITIKLNNMDTANPESTDGTQIPESKTSPEDGLPAVVKKEEDPEKAEVEQEVKETFKDPAVGNDGLEVGGEG
jgi:hypothetical protein